MQDRPGLALGFAALAPVAAVAILMSTPSSVPNTNAALVLVVVVVVTAATSVVRPDLDQGRTAVALADHAASAFAAVPATAVPVVVPAGGVADPTG